MEKQKLNLICLSSLCVGVLNIPIGGLNNPDIWLVILSGFLSVIGLVLAFWGRINAHKTNTRGKKMALAGFIVGMTMLAGGIIYMVGYPSYKMPVMIPVSFVLCAICAVLAVLYGRIAKKHR